MAKKIILFEVVVSGCSELGAGDGNEGDGGGLECSGASKLDVQRLVSNFCLLAGLIQSCILDNDSLFTIFILHYLAIFDANVGLGRDSLSSTGHNSTVATIYLLAFSFFQKLLLFISSLNNVCVWINSLAFGVSVCGHLRFLWAVDDVGSRDNGDESGDSSVLHILVYLINYINVLYSVL